MTYMSVLVQSQRSREREWGEPVGAPYQVSYPGTPFPRGSFELANAELSPSDALHALLYATELPHQFEAEEYDSFFEDEVLQMEYGEEHFVQALIVRRAKELLRAKLEAAFEEIDAIAIFDVRDNCIRIRRVQKPEWVREFESNGKNDLSSAKLISVIRMLKGMIAEGGELKALNSGMKAIDLSSVSTETMLAILRTSYHVRSKLPAWSAFLDGVRKEITKRALNARELLIGLE